MSIAYFNGDYLPLAEARVPVMDRGFLFGDAAYEVIPVYSRRPFRLAEHLARLARTLDGLRLSNPFDAAGWQAHLEGVIARNAPDDQSLYLQVTRGTDGRRSQAFPPEVAPTVLIFSEPLVAAAPEQRENGVRAVSHDDIRWLRCDLKTTSLVANCLLRQYAVDAGCLETVLFRDGLLTEGTAASIFVVREGTLLAPPPSQLMLPGITHEVVLELAHDLAIPVQSRAIAEREVRAADELWLASSTREVLAIVELDGQRIGSGRPGPLFARMLAAYQDFKRQVMRADG